MAKKTFKDKIELPYSNPALAFISEETKAKIDGENRTQKEEPEATSIDYKRSKVVYIEKKTERLQLLLQPSIKEALQKEAKKKHTSVNELLNEILRGHFNL